MLPELDFISDIVEEQLAKGHLRWMANFTDIHRDYALDGFKVSVYASGGLEEKGFFLSRIFSFFVTPKYGVHFLLHTADEVGAQSLKKLVETCKKNFMKDDWIMIGIVQKRPIRRETKYAILSTDDRRVGIAAYSLTTKEGLSSNTTLGKSLKKRLKLGELRFEAFDLPDFLKSVTIIFSLGTLGLLLLSFINIPAVSPLTLLFMFLLSVIFGYRLYKTRYHTILTMNDRGFKVIKGKSHVEGDWSDYEDASIHISNKRESYIRLSSKDKTVDLPVTRIGLSRRDTYNAITKTLSKK